MIFVAPYLGGTFCTLERVVDHIEHVARVGGEDCVALGSDFDGFMTLPRGLRDAADLPRLTGAALAARLAPAPARQAAGRERAPLPRRRCQRRFACARSARISLIALFPICLSVASQAFR